MAIKISPVDLAAAEARRVQAQSAMRSDTIKRNDTLYQQAYAASKSGKPEELDRLKREKADLERYVKNLTLYAKKVDPRAGTPEHMISQIVGKAGRTQNTIQEMAAGEKYVPGISRTTDIASLAKYGKYEQSNAGFRKAREDLDTTTARIDELTRLLDPEYTAAVPTAPAYDPGRKVSAARAMRERGGRLSTILSQGG